MAFPRPDRRQVAAGLAAAMLAPLAGCSGWRGEGASDHAGRRAVAPGSVKPLVIDPADGLSAVNAVRARHMLAAFAADPQLQRAAETHADWMARTGKYGHEFGPATRFPARLAAAGFEGSAGENLGVGYGSIEAAVEGWLDSPEHRRIMLRPRYDRAGFAYAFNRSGKNPRYTHFWVLIVGRPVSGRSGRGGSGRSGPMMMRAG